MPGAISIGAIPDHLLGIGPIDSFAFRDDFIDANGTLLTNHLPGLYTWVNALGDMTISSNEAGTDVDAACVLDTGISENVRMRTSRMVSNDNFAGFIIRYSNSDNFIIAGADGFTSRWAIWKNVAGGFTNIGTASDSDVPALGADTILNFEVWCSSIDIAIYTNGIIRVKSTADSFNDDATIVGLYSDVVNPTLTSWDDLYVYRISDGLNF